LSRERKSYEIFALNTANTSLLLSLQKNFGMD